jgi:hypothetical protein
MTTLPEVGIHNEDGGVWMVQNQVQGWCLPVVALGKIARQLNFTHFENAGVKVIVRLSYGFGDGDTGTLPDPDDHAESEGFIQAVIQTMANSQGIRGYVLGNEPNNINEFPHHKPITPERYVEVYNRVWKGKPDQAKLAPAATDPYFGPFPNAGQPQYEANNLVWWKKMLAGITDADFFTVHPKTQDSNPDNTSSAEKFGNDPLRWQFFHLRSFEPLLDAIPQRLRPRAVHATEVNPQRRDDGQNGWQPERGREWVEKAMAQFRGWNANPNHDLKINSAIFYRFSEDKWAFNDKQGILDAISDASRAN